MPSSETAAAMYPAGSLELYDMVNGAPSAPVSVRPCTDRSDVIGRRVSHEAPSSKESAQYTPRIANFPPAESRIQVVLYVGPFSYDWLLFANVPEHPDTNAARTCQYCKVKQQLCCEPSVYVTTCQLGKVDTYSASMVDRWTLVVSSPLAGHRVYQ